jgi:hypothetical protein
MSTKITSPDPTRPASHPCKAHGDWAAAIGLAMEKSTRTQISRKKMPRCLASIAAMDRVLLMRIPDVQTDQRPHRCERADCARTGQAIPRRHCTPISKPVGTGGIGFHGRGVHALHAQQNKELQAKKVVTRGDATVTGNARIVTAKRQRCRIPT